MDVIATALNYSTKRLLIEGINDNTFINKVAESLLENPRKSLSEVRARVINSRYLSSDRLKRGSQRLGRRRMFSEGNNFNGAVSTRWKFLINDKDRNHNEIISIMQPLAEHRRMTEPLNPLIFNDQSKSNWSEWVEENHLYNDDFSNFILIVGGPDYIPFEFQSFLSTFSYVGRVHFDSLDELRTYVNKLIKLENSYSPLVSRQALFFASDYGLHDPTHYIRHHLAEPLANNLVTRKRFNVLKVMGDDATKEHLLKKFSECKAALIYGAGNGMVSNESIENQKHINGAICCQKEDDTRQDNWILTADDIPIDGVFLEGAIFYEFASFSYGTTKQSDYNYWVAKEPHIGSEVDFVASIPKKLLSHPRGPIGFIGHLDLGWVYQDNDAENRKLSPSAEELWYQRVKLGIRIINTLLYEGQTIGQAMSVISRRLPIIDEILLNRCELLQSGKVMDTPQLQKRLLSDLIAYTDAKNHMIFGDPAARISFAE